MKMAVGDPIHVCYALHDARGTYSKFVGASLCSLFEHTDARVMVHLLHDATLSEENRERFLRLGRSYGQTISFYEVKLPEELYRAMTRTVLSPGALYRLSIGSILPQDVERLIYLDADTIVNLDISELWQEDLAGAAVGGVRDEYASRIAPANAVVQGKISAEGYFNTGILLVDMGQWRQDPDFAAAAIAFYQENFSDCRYGDQDVINYFFEGRAKLLPQKYNTWDLPAKKEACIYHYAGRKLRMGNGVSSNHVFWEIFIKTPWFDDKLLLRSYESLEELHRTELRRLRGLFSTLQQYLRHVFWGRGGDWERAARMVWPFSEQDVYLYSGEEQTDSLHGEELVAAFQHRKEMRCIVILMTMHYDLVRDWLKGQGWEEGTDFVDGRLLVTDAFARSPEWEYYFVRDM